MRWGEGQAAWKRRIKREQENWHPHFFWCPRQTEEHGWVFWEHGERKRQSGVYWDEYDYRVEDFEGV